MRYRLTILISAFLAALLLVATPSLAAEVEISLRGSPNSMVRQNDVAKTLGYKFVKTPDQLSTLVEEGEFVAIPGNEDHVVLRSVSYAYARPELRLFIERLSEQYHEATGERLVVTSLTRPTTEQPRNSHELSVHPTGIAVDIRISDRRASQQWLESVLLKLERQNLLDVTRERWPPHYHVALFPAEYANHVELMIGAEALAEALEFKDAKEEERPEETVKSAPATATTAAVAIPPMEQDDRSWKHVMILAGLLLAGLFFGVGYWRGVSTTAVTEETEADSSPPGA